MQVKEKDGTTTQPGATPSAGQAGTPTPPQTFTQAELDKAVRDAKSAALADVGRLQKESFTALRTAQEAQERLNQMIAEQDRRELEEARDDPQRLSGLQERQARRREESEHAQTKQKLAQKDELLQQAQTEKAETKRAQVVQETAAKFNVDAIRLARLAKATDGSVEAIEDLAKDLPAGTPKSPLKPDSGGAVGGSLSDKQLQEEFIKNPQGILYGPRREEYLASRARRRGT